MNQPAPNLLIEDDSAYARLIMDALWMAGILDPVVGWIRGGLHRWNRPLFEPAGPPRPLSFPGGFETAEAVRQASPGEKAGVSNHEERAQLDPGDIENAFELDVEPCLIKPKEFAGLVHLIRLKVSNCLGRPLPSPKLDSPDFTQNPGIP